MSIRIGRTRFIASLPVERCKIQIESLHGPYETVFLRVDKQPYIKVWMKQINSDKYEFELQKYPMTVRVWGASLLKSRGYIERQFNDLTLVTFEVSLSTILLVILSMYFILFLVAPSLVFIFAMINDQEISENGILFFLVFSFLLVVNYFEFKRDVKFLIKSVESRLIDSGLGKDKLT